LPPLRHFSFHAYAFFHFTIFISLPPLLFAFADFFRLMIIFSLFIFFFIPFAMLPTPRYDAHAATRAHAADAALFAASLARLPPPPAAA